jgi:hypothetical protein
VKILLVALTLSMGAWAQKDQIVEASGVARRGDYLYIVDDSVGGICFRVRLPASPPRMMSLNSLGPDRIKLAGGRLAIDLEGIDFLADGRLAVISERTRTLIGEDDTLVEYDHPFSEFAKRGMEGVTARPIADQGSRVAVVWEGGYPDYPSVPVPLRSWIGRRAIAPFVLIHDLKRNAQNARIRLPDAVAAFEVLVPLPPGREPLAQRFRISDLAWTRLGATGDEWGLIVLMSSQNSTENVAYQYHWLHRINLKGRLVGRPIDIDAIATGASRGANWEGLGWFEPGKKLVLVHEADPGLEPHALIIDLPHDWQWGSQDSMPSAANHVRK